MLGRWSSEEPMRAFLRFASFGAVSLTALLACGRPPSSGTTTTRVADRKLSRPELLIKLRSWMPRYYTLLPTRDRLVERLEDTSADESLDAIGAEIDDLERLDATFPDAILDDIGYIRGR